MKSLFFSLMLIGLMAVNPSFGDQEFSLESELDLDIPEEMLSEENNEEEFANPDHRDRRHRAPGRVIRAIPDIPDIRSIPTTKPFISARVMTPAGRNIGEATPRPISETTIALTGPR